MERFRAYFVRAKEQYLAGDKTLYAVCRAQVGTGHSVYWNSIAKVLMQRCQAFSAACSWNQGLEALDALIKAHE